jgi:predicted dehydrogenase
MKKIVNSVFLIGQLKLVRKLFFPSKKLGIALVGLGNYSEKKLIPSILKSKYCYIAGIVSGTPDKVNKWAKRLFIPSANCYNYQNFDTIISNASIDIIYIVLPTFMHAEFTIRAANAGKHVICEKPMAMSIDEAESMINACKKANVKLGIGYRLYYEPHHLKLLELVKNKKYGEIKSIESSLGFNIKDKSNWRLNEQLGGGAIMDWGIYLVQNARRLMGTMPVSITSKGENNTMSWEFEFKNGVIVKSYITVSAFTDKLCITFENAIIELSPAYGVSNIKGTAIDKKISRFTKNYQAIAQIDDFAYSILNDTPLLCSGEEGLQDILLIEKIKLAAQTGKKITIS